LVAGLLGVGVVGVAVARYASGIASRLEQYEYLDDRLSGGLLLLLAGVLLLLPGLLTDLVGLALPLPQTRRMVLARLRQHFASAPSYGDEEEDAAPVRLHVSPKSLAA
jgi:UPF0716 protein FxsA